MSEAHIALLSRTPSFYYKYVKRDLHHFSFLNVLSVVAPNRSFFLPSLQSHPGTNVSVIDLFDRSASLEPLWKQVEGFKEAIYPIMQNAADGVHLICYSQGDSSEC